MLEEGWVLWSLHLPTRVWWQVAKASACPQASHRPRQVEASQLRWRLENTVHQRGILHLILSNFGIYTRRHLILMLRPFSVQSEMGLGIRGCERGLCLVLARA